MVAAYRRGRLLKLVRNPHFRVWSQDAQPDGYADAIVWKLGHAPAAQARAVERGTGDVAFDSEGFSPGLVSELQTRYASQLRGNTLARTTYMFLNTRLPLFNDVRVRRALNYAVDRESVVRAVGGQDFAQPTCQFLPPGFAGYRPYCPFTIRPAAGVDWSGPVRTWRKHVALLNSPGRAGRL